MTPIRQSLLPEGALHLEYESVDGKTLAKDPNAPRQPVS